MSDTDKASREFHQISIAVLTVSDTRTDTTDNSGQFLADRIETFGHRLAEKFIVPDNKYFIRAKVSAWIADDNINAIVTTGGTGITGRDVTPEAIYPLFDKSIDGFGELFRQLSFNDIGTSTLQSRAIGGIANATLIFCLPGSSGACRLGWDEILRYQLDIRHGPCNFIEILPRAKER